METPEQVQVGPWVYQLLDRQPDRPMFTRYHNTTWPELPSLRLYPNGAWDQRACPELALLDCIAVQEAFWSNNKPLRWHLSQQVAYLRGDPNTRDRRQEIIQAMQCLITLPVWFKKTREVLTDWCLTHGISVYSE